MHEMALAEAVLEAAQTASPLERLSTVTRIDVQLGQLQRIPVSTFKRCLSLLCEGAYPRFRRTEVRITVEPARFQCRPCRRSFTLHETEHLNPDPQEAVHFLPELIHAFVTCPHCRSADFDIVAGRGVTLVAVHGEANLETDGRPNAS